MKQLHYVCQEQELRPGDRRIIRVGKKSIGVFNIHGKYYALLNVCPHQFAPLCQGTLGGYCPPSDVGEFRLEREGEIIRCPWHGWEFDVKTGRSIFNPHQVKTARYPIHVGSNDEANEAGSPEVETFPVELKDRSIFVEL